MHACADFILYKRKIHGWIFNPVKMCVRVCMGAYVFWLHPDLRGLCLAMLLNKTSEQDSKKDEALQYRDRGGEMVTLITETTKKHRFPRQSQGHPSYRNDLGEVHVIIRLSFF